MGARDEAQRRALTGYARGLSRRKPKVTVEIGEAEMEPRFEVETGEAELEPSIEIGDAVLEKADEDDVPGRPVGTGPHARKR